jgi:hypothetical protein
MSCLDESDSAVNNANFGTESGAEGSVIQLEK